MKTDPGGTSICTPITAKISLVHTGDPGNSVWEWSLRGVRPQQREYSSGPGWPYGCATPTTDAGENVQAHTSCGKWCHQDTWLYLHWWPTVGIHRCREDSPGGTVHPHHSSQEGSQDLFSLGSGSVITCMNVCPNLEPSLHSRMYCSGVLFFEHATRFGLAGIQGFWTGNYKSVCSFLSVEIAFFQKELGSFFFLA